MHQIEMHYGSEVPFATRSYLFYQSCPMNLPTLAEQMTPKKVE